jgi:hypothetical protein
MSKYGVKDVFDLDVYDKKGLVFTIDTVKEVTVGRDNYKREGVLVVEDALIDINIVNDVLNGKYDDKHLRIKGKTSFRDLEGVDHDVSLSVTVAKLNIYNFKMSYDSVSVATLEFNFPTVDAYGFQNAILKVEK